MSAAFELPSSQCQWGTTDTSTAGTVTGSNLARTGLTDVVENAVGAVTGLIIYDVQFQGTVDVVFSAAGTAPAIGATATCGGLSLYITAVSEVQANKGKKTCTITVTGYTSVQGQG